MTKNNQPYVPFLKKLKDPKLASLHLASLLVGGFAILELGLMWGITISFFLTMAIDQWTDKEYRRTHGSAKEDS